MNTRIKLLDGEVFSLNGKTLTVKENPIDEEINAKYKKGEIRIVTEQARYPLDSIVTMLESKQGEKDKYILNPEYQRRKRWNNTRKSRLMESFIMNVPIPPIFLYEVDYSIYEVMDGLQRLTSIYDFYTNKFPLEGLEYWKELNGRYYKDLPEQVKKGIDRRYLSSIVLLQETAKSLEEAERLKQIVFERLNSGGENLTPQETRNALHNGKFNQLCLKLAKNDKFRKMWQFPLESEGEKKLLESERYRKMEDVELVLRFFAYRHIEKLSSPIDQFLDIYLKQANHFDEKTTKTLEKIFLDTIDLVYEIFGDKAFWLPKAQRTYKSPTKTMYDPIMQTFSSYLSQKTIFLANIPALKDSLLQIAGDKNLFNPRYNNKTDVEARIDKFNNTLKPYIENKK